MMGDDDDNDNVNVEVEMYDYKLQDYLNNFPFDVQQIRPSQRSVLDQIH